MRDDALLQLARDLDETGTPARFNGRKPAHTTKPQTKVRPAFLFLLLFGGGMAIATGLPFTKKHPEPSWQFVQKLEAPAKPLEKIAAADPQTLANNPTPAPVVTHSRVIPPAPVVTPKNTVNTPAVKAWLSLPPAQQPAEIAARPNPTPYFPPNNLPSRHGGLVPPFTVELADVATK